MKTLRKACLLFFIGALAYACVELLGFRFVVVCLLLGILAEIFYLRYPKAPNP